MRFLARPIRVFWLTFALALLPQLAANRMMPMPALDRIGERANADEPYFAKIALSLVNEGVFAEGSLRGYRPPGYPFFIAAVAKVTPNASPALQLLQNLMFALSAALLSLVAARRWGPLAGLVAGSLLVSNVAWLVRPQILMSETLFLLLVSGAVLSLDRLLAQPGKGAVLSATTGALLGMSALVREIGLFHIVATAAALLLLAPRTGRLLRPALVVALGIGCVLPWAARNHAVFGRWIPVTTNGPINLYMGNNPIYDAEYGHWSVATSTSAWRIPDRVRERWNQPNSTPADELAVIDAASGDAIAYIKADPAAFVRRGVLKSVRMWGFVPIGDDGLPETVVRVAKNLSWLVLAPLALIGLVVGWRDPLLASLGIALAFAAGIHFVTMGSPNYRLPWEILLVLPASYFVSRQYAQREARITATSVITPAT